MRKRGPQNGGFWKAVEESAQAKTTHPQAFPRNSVWRWAGRGEHRWAEGKGDPQGKGMGAWPLNIQPLSRAPPSEVLAAQRLLGVTGHPPRVP